VARPVPFPQVLTYTWPMDPLEASTTAPREIRKTVTVVFTDVTGSTAMGERLDPESLRRVAMLDGIRPTAL
jgi:class 3 adenylate cyclase